jgi:hypothetical protein
VDRSKKDSFLSGGRVEGSGVGVVWLRIGVWRKDDGCLSTHIRTHTLAHTLSFFFFFFDDAVSGES